MKKVYYFDLVLLMISGILFTFCFKILYIDFNFFQILVCILELVLMIYINKKLKITTKYIPPNKIPLLDEKIGVIFLIGTKILLILVFLLTIISESADFYLIGSFMFPGLGGLVLSYSYLYQDKIISLMNGVINLNDIESIVFNNQLLYKSLILNLKNGEKKEIGISLDEYKRIINKFNKINKEFKY